MRLWAVIAVALLSACSSAEREAEKIVAHDLADPDAVKFRDVEKVGQKRCVGGSLNAKNRMGAYTGFRPFLVDLTKKEAAILPDDPTTEDGRTLQHVRFDIFRSDCGIEN